MFKHIVLTKFHDDYNPATLDAAIQKMNALPGQIPDIVSFSHGRNAGVTDNQYDYGIVVEFVSKKHYVAYLSHPSHRVLGGDLNQLIADVAQIQFEY